MLRAVTPCGVALFASTGRLGRAPRRRLLAAALAIAAGINAPHYMRNPDLSGSRQVCTAASLGDTQVIVQ